MRVLLLADRSFATREHAMLRRLEIGLIDEGLRVVRANPPVPNPEPTTGLAGALTYNDRAWRYIMPAPERTLARDLMNLSLEARPDSDEERCKGKDCQNAEHYRRMEHVLRPLLNAGLIQVHRSSPRTRQAPRPRCTKGRDRGR